MELTPKLLDNTPGLLKSPGDFYACLNAHGLYNSMQFVLRLSPDVHNKISNLPNGVITGGASFETLQAVSTYLHETIHWWQHMGSTMGFMSSLSYPIQAHANYKYLKDLITSVGAQKSIRRLNEALPSSNSPDKPGGLTNIIINNYFDIEYFRFLINDPKHAKQITSSPFFECVAHSYKVAYGNILLLLAPLFGNDFNIIPDPREWENAFTELQSAKVQGFYHGSDVRVSPIGALQIFEGQARFSQLQFLYFASGKSLTWQDVESQGMLSHVYREAFDGFLELCELEWPPSIEHPTVALFLLICDIAINPGEGFPMPLKSFETFISDIDPGQRFLFLCRIVAIKYPQFAKSIRDYSRNEYEEISEALSSALMFASPMKVSNTVLKWMSSCQGIRHLMDQFDNFNYDLGNLPISVMLSHFIAFNKDKASRPEFFCWPGAWMVGERLLSEIPLLFERHSALFVDKADNDGIFYRLQLEKEEENVNKTFQNFYAAVVTYDMTRQWIGTPGPFEYDYRWLKSSGKGSDLKKFADTQFMQIYGIHPNEFKIL